MKYKRRFCFDTSKAPHDHVLVYSSDFVISSLQAEVVQDVEEISDDQGYVHEIFGIICIFGTFTTFDRVDYSKGKSFDIILKTYDPVNNITYQSKIIGCLVQYVDDDHRVCFTASKFAYWDPSEKIKDRENRINIEKKGNRNVW